MNAVHDTDKAAELVRRIAALRAEIASATAKADRLQCAILHRRQILSRLEARLAMRGGTAEPTPRDE